MQGEMDVRVSLELQYTCTHLLQSENPYSNIADLFNFLSKLLLNLLGVAGSGTKKLGFGSLLHVRTSERMALK